MLILVDQVKVFVNPASLLEQILRSNPLLGIGVAVQLLQFKSYLSPFLVTMQALKVVIELRLTLGLGGSVSRSVTSSESLELVEALSRATRSGNGFHCSLVYLKIYWSRARMRKLRG